MAKLISAADLAATLGGAEMIPGVQSGGDVRITPELLRAYILGTSASHRNLAGRVGGFEVWQEGSSVAVAASTTSYTADGWYLATGADQASVVSRVAGITSRSRYAAQVARNSSQTGTGTIRFAAPLDEVEVPTLSGQRCVLSFTAKAGADWSPSSGTLTYNVYVGTGGSVAKRNATPYGTETNPITGTVNLTAGGSATTVTSSISTALPASVTSAEIQFSWTPTGTAGAADNVQIDDLQFEAVPSGVTTWAPVFERRPYSDTLVDCQRHLIVFAAAAAGAPLGQGICYTTTDAQVPVIFARPMRRVPTLSVSAASDWQLLASAGSGVTCSAVGTVAGNATGWNLNVSVAAGLTAGDATQMQASNTSAVIRFRGTI